VLFLEAIINYEQFISIIEIQISEQN